MRLQRGWLAWVDRQRGTEQRAVPSPVPGAQAEGLAMLGSRPPRESPVSSRAEGHGGHRGRDASAKWAAGAAHFPGTGSTPSSQAGGTPRAAFRDTRNTVKETTFLSCYCADAFSAEATCHYTGCRRKRGESTDTPVLCQGQAG